MPGRVGDRGFKGDTVRTDVCRVSGFSRTKLTKIDHESRIISDFFSQVYLAQSNRLGKPGICKTILGLK